MAHSGVFWNDPRNLAIGRFLQPEALTAQSVTARLLRVYAGKPPADLAEKVARIMTRPTGADMLPDQSLDSVADPHFGLGTHPDLIERLWKLNASLPEDCRWVVYGKPALVHPKAGIVFGFATGTLGYVLRLSEPHRAEADRLGAKVRVELRGRDAFDLSLAGPEWRFGKWFDQEAAWCRAAYDRAAEE